MTTHPHVHTQTEWYYILKTNGIKVFKLDFKQTYHKTLARLDR